MEANDNDNFTESFVMKDDETRRILVNNENDIVNKSSDLLQRIKDLEIEKEKMQTSFNGQRAKMKDLYVQKERELDEFKTKYIMAEIKAQEEISSLQQLVQDTIEESTICKADLEHLKLQNASLSQKNKEFRSMVTTPQLTYSTQSIVSSELSSLAPQVLNQMKTLVRKLGGDSMNSPTDLPANTVDVDNSNDLDKKYANEDAEVLSSIVTQLQEEMKALKEKLREADDKLQCSSDAQKNNLTDCMQNIQTQTDSMTLKIEYDDCSHCLNWQNQVQKYTTDAIKDQKKIEELEKQIKEFNKELEKEAALRHVLENQWQDKREAYKNEMHLLKEQVTNSEQQLFQLEEKLLQTKNEVFRQLERVGADRERVNKQLEILQADNDFLSGRYLATAEEIENQYINLPNTVTELHELILQQQQDLIKARLACDYEKRCYTTSLEEVIILRDQLETGNREYSDCKRKYKEEIESLQKRITDYLMKFQNFEIIKVSWERKESELNRQISTVRVENIELQQTNEKLTKMLADAKTKIKMLQDDLSDSEQTQKDFVRLSQHLQMALEQLRHADSEVRWQDEEDVSNCPNCSIDFTVTVRPIHCRHCGRIYCDKCLTKLIESGPRKRLARVCDICHTLLSPNTAPYFSETQIATTDT